MSSFNSPNPSSAAHGVAHANFQAVRDELANAETKIKADNVNVFYGNKQALTDISLRFPAGYITALIGPSGCGKSTFLRCINRMNDVIESCSVSGSIKLNDVEITGDNKKLDVVTLRRHVGMVFQKPNPFPKSIRENVLYGPKIHGLAKGSALNDLMEESLKNAGLWDEVKDRLDDMGTSLSGGQQQRLCIARALAVDPEVILMDEPCSALDPIATARIENLMLELKGKYTIIIVTHSMQQAARVSDQTAFFHLGEMVECDITTQIFQNPQVKKTEEYITGRFG